MKKNFLIKIILVFLFLQGSVFALTIQDTLSLNGFADFEQTENCLPPKQFSHKIPVPGLIDLAIPKINQYDHYFICKQEPLYNWYRFSFNVPSSQKGKFAILKILKSYFNTQIILNGQDYGTHLQCNTPIEIDLTRHLKFGSENILLVRVGDRSQLPSESAHGVDREKFTEIPGIWDDIFIEFTGPIYIHKFLLIPDIDKSNVLAKIKVKNLSPKVERDLELSSLFYSLKIFIREKKSKKIVSSTIVKNSRLRGLQEEQLTIEIPLTNFQKWSPENPFLYEAVIIATPDSIPFLNYGNPLIMKKQFNKNINLTPHIVNATFGMREFQSKGNYFELNGLRYQMFGSTITLNRFFEDRERTDLPWNKEWVKKLFIEIPKSLGWNSMRISLGLLPKFWYDLADEYGLLLQNEYPMWNLRGSELEILEEYTDWIWSDGNHPSIIIWDALNENISDFIGDELIPKLKKIDPSRIWDAGWIGLDGNKNIDMMEIHWYSLGFGWWSTDEFITKQRNDYRFGRLTKYDQSISQFSKYKVPLLLNEYCWLWLNRDAQKSAIRSYGGFHQSDSTPLTTNYEYFEEDGTQLYTNRDIFEYYLGKDVSAEERRDFQAYLLAIETETARSSRLFSGIISFPYLTNNHGYTGDWFKDSIKKLIPTQTLLIQKNCMKSFAVFVDLEDGRYLKNELKFQVGGTLSFNLFAINDNNFVKQGNVNIKLLNHKNEIILSTSTKINVEPFSSDVIPVCLKLPNEAGGYALISELREEENKNNSQISLRYIKVGNINKYNFTDLKSIIRYDQ